MFLFNINLFLGLILGILPTYAFGSNLEKSVDQSVSDQAVNQTVDHDQIDKEEIIANLYSTNGDKFEVDPTGTFMFLEGKKHLIDDLLVAKRILDTNDTNDESQLKQIIKEKPLIFEGINAFLLKQQSRDKSGNPVFDYSIIYKQDPMLGELKEVSGMLENFFDIFYTANNAQLEEESKNLLTLRLEQLPIKPILDEDLRYSKDFYTDIDDEIENIIRLVGSACTQWLQENVAFNKDNMPNSYISEEIWMIMHKFFYDELEYSADISLPNLTVPLWFQKLINTSSNERKFCLKLTVQSRQTGQTIIPSVGIGCVSFFLSQKISREILFNKANFLGGIRSPNNFEVLPIDEKFIKQAYLLYFKINNRELFDSSLDRFSLQDIIYEATRLIYNVPHYNISGNDNIRSDLPSNRSYDHFPWDFTSAAYSETGSRVGLATNSKLDDYIEQIFSARELMKDLKQLDGHIAGLENNQDQNSILTTERLKRMKENLISKYRSNNLQFIESTKDESALSKIMAEPYLKDSELHLLFQDLRGIFENRGSLD